MGKQVSQKRYSKQKQLNKSYYEVFSSLQLKTFLLNAFLCHLHVGYIRFAFVNRILSYSY